MSTPIRPWQQNAIPWDRTANPRPIIAADLETEHPKPEKGPREPWTQRQKRTTAAVAVLVMVLCITGVVLRRVTAPPPQERWVAVCVDAATLARVPDTATCGSRPTTHDLYVHHGGMVPAVGQVAILGPDVSLVEPSGAHVMARGFGAEGGRVG